MLWAQKPKAISPIASNIERKLLERAYTKQPSNEQVFNKLFEILLHENKLERAIKLCTKHLELIAKDDYVFAALTYCYRKLNDFDNVIGVGELAIKYVPTLATRLHLAYAYIQKDRFDLAKQLMPNDNECMSMTRLNLRLTLDLHLLMQQPQEVRRRYCDLPRQKQSDSGLRSRYIKSLHQLGLQTELSKLLNHDAMIKQYTLEMPNNDSPIKMVNQELATFLASHSKLLFEPGNHTAKLGSQMHFEPDWHPLLKDLEVQIKLTIERYLNESVTVKKDKQQLFSLHFWANVLTKGGHQVSHIHPDAMISGVYYVQVPRSIEHAAEANTYQGYLLFSQEESCRHYVRPSDSLLVLFPSYFHHQTIPLDHQETRVCIAFDVVSERIIPQAV